MQLVHCRDSSPCILSAEAHKTLHPKSQDGRPRVRRARQKFTSTRVYADFWGGMEEGSGELQPIEPSKTGHDPDHMLIMVNGLFGHMDNW